MVALKHCLSCGDPIKGRSDKKYCNDYCRNAYNNQLKASGDNLVRCINKSLGRNRRILKTLLGDTINTLKTTKENLVRQGFHFNFFTHIYNTKNGKTYFYCYEFGWLPLENDGVLVVRSRHSPGYIK